MGLSSSRNIEKAKSSCRIIESLFRAKYKNSNVMLFNPIGSYVFLNKFVMYVEVEVTEGDYIGTYFSIPEEALKNDYESALIDIVEESIKKRGYNDGKWRNFYAKSYKV